MTSSSTAVTSSPVVHSLVRPRPRNPVEIDPRQMAQQRTSSKTAADADSHLNEVRVRGRLGAEAEVRVLPSGDEIATWRLIVGRTGPPTGPKVDVIDCVAFTARIRRRVVNWRPGDVIEVTGSLRRRFWRGPGGVQSRCEVQVDTAGRTANGVP
jgi:single-strand DNA-binding protein